MTLRKRSRKAKIIRYQIPKAAAGGSGSGSGGDGPGGYKPGQNLICKIIRQEPGGYTVVDKVTGQAGFLPSDQLHKPYDEVLAQFVCVDKDRILLSERFTAGSGASINPSANWLEQLEDPDGL